MNNFLLFKDYLVRSQDDLKDKYSDLENDLNKLYYILTNWDKVKIVEANLSLMAKIKKILFPRKYRDSFRGKLEAKRIEIEEKCDKVHYLLGGIDDTIKSFSSTKAIRATLNPIMLIYLCNEARLNGIIDTQGLSQIMGSAWVFNSTHSDLTNELDLKKNMLISNIAKFFNQYGEFVINDSEENLKSLYRELITGDEEDLDFIVRNDKFCSLLEMIDEMVFCYNDFTLNHEDKDLIEVLQVNKVARDNNASKTFDSQNSLLSSGLSLGLTRKRSRQVY